MYCLIRELKTDCIPELNLSMPKRKRATPVIKRRISFMVYIVGDNMAS